MHSKELFDYKDSQILSAFAWWEKNRINFNLIVGTTGLFMLFLSQTINTEDAIGIIFYGIGANLCYSLGFLIEVAVKYYSKGSRDLSTNRALLYILGTFISIIITIVAGLLRIFIYQD